MNQIKFALDLLLKQAKTYSGRFWRSRLYPPIEVFRIPILMVKLDVGHFDTAGESCSTPLAVWIGVQRKHNHCIVHLSYKLGDLPVAVLNELHYSFADSTLSTGEIEQFIMVARSRMHLLRQALAGAYAPHHTPEPESFEA